MRPLSIFLFFCLCIASYTLDAQATDSTAPIPRCLELRETLGPFFSGPQDHRQVLDLLLSTYEEVKDCQPDFLIVVDLNLAKHYTRFGRFDSCLYYSKHALEIYQEDTTVLNLEQVASLYSFMGSSHFQLRQFTACLDYEFKALKLRETHQLQYLGNSYSNIANTYMEIKDYPKALTYFSLAESEYEKQADEASLAFLYLNLGNAYSKLHNIVKSKNYLQKAMDYARANDDEWLEMDVLRVLTPLDDEIKDYLLLLEHTLRGIELAERLEDSLTLLEMYNNRFVAYTQLEKWEAAQTDRQTIESLLGLFGSSYERSVYYENLVPYFVRQSAYDSAALYYQRFQAIEDSVKEAELLEKVAELETRYETEKKAQRIAFLEFETEERAQREHLYCVIGGLLLVFVLILGRLYRLRTQRNRELKALNTLKDQFFGILAHDLKTPLVGFRSITEALQLHHTTLPEERVRYFLGQMQNAAHQLYDLLQNLLQWALSQTGRLRYVPQTLNLHQEVQRALDLLRPTATIKSIALEQTLSPEWSLWADPQLTQTILRNLLDNAIKFTPSNGRVWVTAEAAGTFWRLRVCDTGPGMTAEQQAALFEGALHTGPKVAGSGTGLGLVLCRELVERQGGRIGVESTLGAGTQFWFTLPISSSVQNQSS